LIAVPHRTDTSQDDFRDRAARTKRLRSRTALITAADATFSARGWTNTRIEDVAALAGVSTATAYNHFPTKHALLAAVYAPYLHTLVAQAKHAITDRRPVVAALVDQVHALARLSWHHRELTAAFSAAILDYTVRVGRAPDPDDRTDPRNLTPLIDTLSPSARGRDRSVTTTSGVAWSSCSMAVCPSGQHATTSMSCSACRVAASASRIRSWSSTTITRITPPPGEPARRQVERSEPAPRSSPDAPVLSEPAPG
jgi:AcrR family transcriptional regulator